MRFVWMTMTTRWVEIYSRRFYNKRMETMKTMSHSIKIQCILQSSICLLALSKWLSQSDREKYLVYEKCMDACKISWIELRDYCNIKRLFNLMDYKSLNSISENGHQLRTLLHIKIMSISRHYSLHSSIIPLSSSTSKQHNRDKKKLRKICQLKSASF